MQTFMYAYRHMYTPKNIYLIQSETEAQADPHPSLHAAVSTAPPWLEVLMLQVVDDLHQ